MDFLTKFDPIIKPQENGSRNTLLVTILRGNIELDLAGDETILTKSSTVRHWWHVGAYDLTC
jgi:hypothetical protein